MLRTKTNALSVIVCIAAGASLAGCATAAIEGGRAIESEVVINKNIEAAEAGDAEAQFKVGDAYCCSVHEGSGLYNTVTSVEWLCKSARQGYSPAMVKLGQIYSGDVIDGVRLARRAAQTVAGTSEDMTVAYTWANFAARLDDEDGSDLAAKLLSDLDTAERALANQYFAMGYDAPCAWDEVNPT